MDLSNHATDWEVPVRRWMDTPIKGVVGK
jgi:hypothetical protein